MGKIIFLDVDGTLVDYENHLPESAVLAVRKARENGHRVYICTGRSKAEVYENIWEIGLDGMIGGNGSYVEDHGHVVMHQMITPEQCRHIVDWLKEHRLEFYLESNAGLFASAGFEEAGEPVIQEYSRRKGKEGADKIKVRDVFPEMIFDGELYRDDVNKVSFILNQYQDYRDAVVEFPDLQAGTWGGAGEIALFGDLGVKKKYHQGQCYCASVRISSCRCGRYHSFWGCQSGYSYVRILWLWCGYGKRRRRDKGYGRLCHRGCR